MIYLTELPSIILSLLDRRYRSVFRVPGAYARVHISMLSLVESLETIFKTSYTGEDFRSFQLYTIEKVVEGSS